nr:hypothetical protein [Mycobacterium sp. 852002-51057_SCH5723018]
MVAESFGFGYLAVDVGLVPSSTSRCALALFVRAPKSLAFPLGGRALAFVGAALSLVRHTLAIVCDLLTLVSDPVSSVSEEVAS